MLLGALLAATAALGAQEPPVFRADIDVIRLDVTVIDRDRAPVRGLTAADFTVTEDGRPQRIVAVTEIRASENDPVLTPRMRFVPRDVAANDMVDRLGDGRVFVILLDDFNVPFDDEDIIRSTREAARYVVDSLGPSDVAAVVFTAQAGNTVDFTDDRQKLLTAIDRFDPPKRYPGYTAPTPRGPGPTEGDIVQRWAPVLMRSQCMRAQPLAPTLETVTLRLAAIPNRRKTVVLLSTGAPLTVGESRGCGGEQAAAIRAAFASALRANINIYTVDPAGNRGYENYLQHPMRNMSPGMRNLSPQEAAARARTVRDFLRTVSENTGGRAVVSTDSPEPELDRMFAEDGSYYLVGYQSSNTRADGRFRKIEVSVKQPNVTVRARSGYFAAREGELVRSDRTPAASANELGLSGMSNPVGVSLRTAATAVGLADAGKSRDAMVGVVLTLGYPASAGTIDERLTVTRNVYDADGRASAPTQERVSLTLLPAGLDGQRQSLFYALRLPPGRHQVRFEVHSTALGKASSILADVEVPDFTRPRLSASSIVLGAPAADRNDPLVPLLPIVPTAEREFAANARPTAFVRVLQAGSPQPGAVEMLTEIIDGRDRTVFSTTETLPADAFTGAGGAPFQTALPLAGLDRGPYILSITAQTAGTGPVRRELLFRIR